MNIPNDMSAEAQVYYREHVDAGASEHAAKAYALACAERDDARARAKELRNMPELSGAASQVLLACIKSAADASSTAEKLRAALPVDTKPSAPSDDPDGVFAGDDPDGRFTR